MLFLLGGSVTRFILGIRMVHAPGLASRVILVLFVVVDDDDDRREHPHEGERRRAHTFEALM